MCARALFFHKGFPCFAKRKFALPLYILQEEEERLGGEEGSPGEGTVGNATQLQVSEEAGNTVCQQMSLSGRTYVGEANTTIDGIPCQNWSETKPHDHSFIHVGEHNFCRNPIGADEPQVW